MPFPLEKISAYQLLVKIKHLCNSFHRSYNLMRLRGDDFEWLHEYYRKRESCMFGSEESLKVAKSRFRILFPRTIP